MKAWLLKLHAGQWRQFISLQFPSSSLSFSSHTTPNFTKKNRTPSPIMALIPYGHSWRPPDASETQQILTKFETITTRQTVSCRGVTPNGRYPQQVSANDALRMHLYLFARGRFRTSRDEVSNELLSNRINHRHESPDHARYLHSGFLSAITCGERAATGKHQLLSWLLST